MRVSRLFIALLGLTLMALLSGVEGQYPQNTLPTGYSEMLNPSTIQTGQVSQAPDVYYTVGQSPGMHITAPQEFAPSTSPPSTVYIGTDQQPLTFSQFQSNPTYYGINSLWITGSTTWTQYARVPQGSIVPLLALSPNGGEGSIKEINPNGYAKNYNFYFYPRSSLKFYADTIGRHELTFFLVGPYGNQVSKAVTIDVYSPAPTYSSGYYGYNYPWYWNEYPWYWNEYPWYWSDWPWYWDGYWWNNYYPDWDHDKDHRDHDGRDHDGGDHRPPPPPPHDGKDHKGPYPHDGKDNKGLHPYEYNLRGQIGRTGESSHIGSHGSYIGSGGSSHIGSHSSFIGSGGSSHIGSHSSFIGSGGSSHIGSHSSFIGSGGSSHVGSHSSFIGSGGSSHVGSHGGDHGGSWW